MKRAELSEDRFGNEREELVNFERSKIDASRYSTDAKKDAPDA
jgi:hypothetical protein